MGLKRFIKKGLSGGFVTGHLMDAVQKKENSGKPFLVCLEETVKETFAEDLPGTSHLYKLGEKDGRVKGTVEQAKRDKKKIQELNDAHERDRSKWKRIDERKNTLINDLLKE